MKVRLEITLDNGITKESHIQGTPTPEAILDLVNQLMSLPISASSHPATPETLQTTMQQTTSQASRSPPSWHTPQWFPAHNNTSQSPSHQPTNNRGTRTLQLAEDEYSKLKNESLTIKERLELFLNFEYKGQWFTSLDVKKDYDRVYSTINLSTVSTYLSRLYREGKLERTGNRNQRKYCLKTEEEQQQSTPERIWDQSMRSY